MQMKSSSKGGESPERSQTSRVRLMYSAHRGCLYTSGGIGLSERPADPGEPPYPSIWDLQEMKSFVRDFDGWVQYLDQCRYGAPSMKPTMVGIFGVFDRSG